MEYDCTHSLSSLKFPLQWVNAQCPFCKVGFSVIVGEGEGIKIMPFVNTFSCILPVYIILLGKKKSGLNELNNSRMNE
jgi:hypothetical protein